MRLPVIAALLCGLLGSIDARAACDSCLFAGSCEPDFRPCVPSEARCAPAGGIVGFNSLPQNVPVYWNFFVDDRGRASSQLAGRLEAWADYAAGVPAVPSFPATCTPPPDESPFCFNQPARLRARVRRDRLIGRVRYPDGRCTFNFALAFGTEWAGTPNTFACRDARGAVLSEGALQVQILRVHGCRR